MKTVTFDPELWQLVPVKSNAVMRHAGWKNLSCMGSCGEVSPPDPSDFGDVYDAMVSAAPQPPAEKLKDLSDDEILQMAASVMIRVREAACNRKPKFNYTVEIARMVILADRKLNEPAEPMKEKLMSAESRIKELEAGNNDLQSCENEYLKEIEELKTQLAQGGEQVAWVAKSLEELPAGTLFTRHMPDEGVMRDALRLDYIEKNSQPNERANGLHVWWPKTFGNQLKGPTLREAIDAAIAKGEV